MKKDVDRIWCSNRQCKEECCVRHDSFAPLNTVILVQKFQREPGKACKHFLSEWPEKEKDHKNKKSQKKPTKQKVMFEEEQGRNDIPGQMRIVFDQNDNTKAKGK